MQLARPAAGKALPASLGVRAQRVSRPQPNNLSQLNSSAAPCPRAEFDVSRLDSTSAQPNSPPPPPAARAFYSRPPRPAEPPSLARLTMASSDPIHRPIPRRAFDFTSLDPDSAPGSPIDPSESGLKPTRSFVSLTRSTLFGIYDDVPATPSQLSRSSSMMNVPDQVARTHTPMPPAPETSLRAREEAAAAHRRGGAAAGSFLWRLVWTVPSLFALGVAYGAIVTHLHDRSGISPSPVRLYLDFNRYDPLYLLGWGIAGVGLGSLLPWLDGSNRPYGVATEKNADWSEAVRSVGAFVGIAFAIVSLLVPLPPISPSPPRSLSFSMVVVEWAQAETWQTAQDSMGEHTAGVTNPRPRQSVPVVRGRPHARRLLVLGTGRRHRHRRATQHQPARHPAPRHDHSYILLRSVVVVIGERGWRRRLDRQRALLQLRLLRQRRPKTRPLGPERRRRRWPIQTDIN